MFFQGASEYSLRKDKTRDGRTGKSASTAQAVWLTLCGDMDFHGLYSAPSSETSSRARAEDGQRKGTGKFTEQNPWRVIATKAEEASANLCKACAPWSTRACRLLAEVTTRCKDIPWQGTGHGFIQCRQMMRQADTRAKHYLFKKIFFFKEAFLSMFFSL